MTYGASLDWLNFLLADVRGGLGPYVSVFLLTQAHWDQATIGAVLTVSGSSVSHCIRRWVRLSTRPIGNGRSSLPAWLPCPYVRSIPWAPTVPVVLAADITMAVLGAVFAPTVAAITLSLVGQDRLAARLGRNAAFDRLGNLAIAAIAGAVGTAFSASGGVLFGAGSSLRSRPQPSCPF